MGRIVMMGRDHLGVAENSVCHPIKKEFYEGTHPEEYAKTWSQLDEKMKTGVLVWKQAHCLLSIHQTDLSVGTITQTPLHSTLSSLGLEKGDGWFKYIEPTSKEVITISDVQRLAVEGRLLWCIWVR